MTALAGRFPDTRRIAYLIAGTLRNECRDRYPEAAHFRSMPINPHSPHTSNRPDS
ncbi:MAG: hypothetical protein WC593_04055 [Methanoregula sp.]